MMVRGSGYSVSPFLKKRLELSRPIQSSLEEGIRDLVLQHWNLECGLLSKDQRQEALNNYASRSGEFTSLFDLYGKKVMITTDMGQFERGFCMATTKVFEEGHTDGLVYKSVRKIATMVDQFLFGGY